MYFLLGTSIELWKIGDNKITFSNKNSDNNHDIFVPTLQTLR